MRYAKENSVSYALCVDRRRSSLNSISLPAISQILKIEIWAYKLHINELFLTGGGCEEDVISKNIPLFLICYNKRRFVLCLHGSFRC